MTLRAYEVDCDDVLDLADPAIRSANGVRSADLARPWKDLSAGGEVPPSQALADRLVADGCAGIIVPSLAAGATSRDVNVVFWIWGSERPYRLRVIDDHARLPRTGASWSP